MTDKDINALIKEHKIDTNQVSDGYHTFGELYEHRIALWITLCREVSANNKIPPYADYPAVWRTQYHSDGELAFGGGWFVLGIHKEQGMQMTYHLPMNYWDECGFAQTLDKAPEFDGHTSADVLKRLNGY